MRTFLGQRTVSGGLAVLLAGGAAGAATPATNPADAVAAAGGFVDDFVAGRDAPLTAGATPALKDALEKTSPADVRAKTIGPAAKAAGPDKVVVSCTRRVTGADGKAYEITATVADGKLAGFFVRLVP